jgi:prolycopene isomerase
MLPLPSLYCFHAGDVARKYIKDPELLKFIDLECFIWSTVNADMTPMINAGMVFCDRHFGGINYPVGGVGAIAENMVDGEIQLFAVFVASTKISCQVPFFDVAASSVCFGRAD